MTDEEVVIIHLATEFVELYLIKIVAESFKLGWSLIPKSKILASKNHNLSTNRKCRKSSLFLI